MKSVLTAIIGVALGAFLFTVPMAGAANGDGTGPDGKGCRMMTENGERPCKGKMMHHGKGQGKMMHHKKGCDGRGQGAGFVDANGDGICDNHAKMMADGACSNCGKGNGKGHMMKQGKGFVDADGNGVCDHHPDNATTEKK